MSRSLGFALVCCALLSALASGSHGQEALPRPNEAEVKIEAALGEPARLHFVDQPLADVVEQLAKRHKIAIQIDNKALTDSGVGSNTPVTASVKGATLRSALRLMLDPLDLTYVIRDEVLLITTKTEAENMLIFKIYPVGDLVSADNGLVPPPAPGQVSEQEDYLGLTELITSCVAPTSWGEGSGPPPLREFRHAHALGFSQTAEVHEEVAALLGALRQARHKQRMAAKLLEKSAEKPQPVAADSMYVRVYPVGIALGMRSMHGQGMGGGFFAVAAEAPAEQKPADADAAGAKPAGGNAAEQPAANPAPPPVAPAAEDRKPTSTTSPVPSTPDTELLDRWTKEIAEILPEVVAPESWAPEGEGFVRIAAGSLIVRQTDAAHRKIELFLDELFSGSRFGLGGWRMNWLDAPPAPLAVPGPQVDWPQEAEPLPNPLEAAIEKALDARLDLSFADTPFSEVIEYFKQKTQLDIQVDSKALADEGLGMDAPITRKLAGVTLRSALRLMLRDLDLTYAIHNESLIITSKTCEENMLSCKVYPVFDLAVRPSNGPQRGQALDYYSLVQNLTCNIAITSWDEVGGPGAIQQFPNAGVLVISQTTQAHEEIARYLRALREVGAEQ